MRAIYLFLMLSLVLFQSCDSDDNSSNENDFINGTWNLRNINGGLAGIDEDFEEGNIIWTFNLENETLDIIKVGNANTYPGPDAGSYAVSIEYHINVPILFLDGNEFGGINLLKNGFVIDQNVLSNGSGADGFVFTLLKHLEE